MTSDTRPVPEKLDEAECLRLIAPGGVGRIAYAGSYDLTVLPVNYRLVGRSVLFRTEAGGLTDTDLRSEIGMGEYRVAFEVDRLDEACKQGWSVLIQGPAHHLDSAQEQAAARAAGVEPWAGGQRDRFISITPTRITGRRLGGASS